MWFFGNITLAGVVLGGLLALAVFGGPKGRTIVMFLIALLIIITSNTTVSLVVAGVVIGVSVYIIMEKYATSKTLKHFIVKYGGNDWSDVDFYKASYSTEWDNYYHRMQWRICGPVLIILLIGTLTALIILT